MAHGLSTGTFVPEPKEEEGCLRSGMGIILGVRVVLEADADTTRVDAEDG